MQVSRQVYYDVKVAVNFVESKAQISRHSGATSINFNAAIDKIIKTWYDNNMLDLTLILKTVIYKSKLLDFQYYTSLVLDVFYTPLIKITSFL